MGNINQVYCFYVRVLGQTVNWQENGRPNGHLSRSIIINQNFTGINGDINGTITAENLVAGNARKRNKLISISKDHINDSQEQTSTNDDESAIEDIEQMLILPIMRQQLENVQVTKWANQADSNETIEIKYDDLEELEQQITLSSLNEWEVGTVNVSRKFKAHQRQLVTSVRQKKTKLTWNNTFELLQSPIINNCNVLVLSLFYITSSEWRQVINSNPYKTTLPILTDSLL
ncbi:8189_t:CDS:2 [Funneliformis geosporum]|uniref:8189_t:CDS:1 n=1 Tax=Funneliformis geosporum TaxID=1117311 RepID=A0A9W4X281_9GLOM|nr:8189_t:CDS:2 [Funneliformis geosporum]